MFCESELARPSPTTHVVWGEGLALGIWLRLHRIVAM